MRRIGTFGDPTSDVFPRLGISSPMRIGCGLKVNRIKGHEYVYFWHYESEDGARKQVQDYVGPARDPASRSEAARRMAAYYDRCIAEIQRRRTLLVRAMRA